MIARTRTNIAEDRHGITGWIWFACERNEVPELAQTVIVEWKKRFTRRLGDAFYNPYTYRARIRLSIPLWPRASEEDRRETVIHETCHIVVKYKFNPFIADHGPEWKQAMKNCGVTATRTHSVDRTGLTRPRRRFVVLDCPNQEIDHKCRINVTEYKLWQAGTDFLCNRCGLKITQESSIEEERTTTLPNSIACSPTCC